MVASVKRRSAYPRPLADLVAAAMDPLAAKRGFGESDLIRHWESIVGERLAAACEPIRLQWPSPASLATSEAQASPATLHLRVEGARALDVQHLASVIRDRVNARLGWRCIDRIVLKQGPLERRRKEPRRKLTPDEEAAERAQEITCNVEDAELREALGRLGAALLTKPKAR